MTTRAVHWIRSSVGHPMCVCVVTVTDRSGQCGHYGQFITALSVQPIALFDIINWYYVTMRTAAEADMTTTMMMMMMKQITMTTASVSSHHIQHDVDLVCVVTALGNTGHAVRRLASVTVTSCHLHYRLTLYGA